MQARVREERTGWRDEALSRRHRLWGWDCPAIDIDFLLIEYDKGEPVALVEYKHEKASLLNRQHPSYRALRCLCDKAEIPFFVVRYADDFTWWCVLPLNLLAKKTRSSQRWGSFWTEQNWVEFLYSLRGYQLPSFVYGDDGKIVSF